MSGHSQGVKRYALEWSLQSAVLAVLLFAVTAAAWLGVLAADDGMQMHGAMGLSLAAALTFTLQWGVMMAAMMLPSAAPMILLYAGARRRSAAAGGRAIPAELFAATYLAVWMLTGIPVYAGYVAAGRLAAASPVFDEAVPYMIAATLLAAGIYQLTPAKHACLRACESPVDFLMRRWRGGYLATFGLAASHAAYCVGCCWALMVVLVVAGAMSLPWVLLIALVTFAEKVLPAGGRTARIVGAGLIATAIAMVVRPELASVMRPMGMH
jgi:predicted metal-binding membrane protein